MSRGLLVWLALAAGVAAAGVLGGRGLKGAGPEGLAFEINAPPYSGADVPQAHTRAGFSGFGATGGFGGAPIVAGRVTAVGADSLTLATGAGTNTIRVAGAEKLRILQPFQGAITPGTTVIIIRKPGTDEAKAVLAVLAP